nr:S8 family serine peptidase [Actinomyces naeslundii]
MSESPRLDHLNVNGYVESKPRTVRGMGTTAIRPVDRQTHGKRLIKEIEATFARAQITQDSQNLAPELKANGTYLTLEGAEVEFGLKLDSLTRAARTRTKSRKVQWILLSAHPATESSPERATIWVADEFRKQFLRLFQDYLTKNTDSGTPENNALVANISRVRSTFLDDLWTSKYAPTHRELTWWELWLDRHRERPGIFERITRELGIEASNQRIVIDNSAVVRVRAIWNDLLPLIETDLPLTEIRCPSFIDTIEDLTDSEQLEYASDLVTRIFPAPLEAPAVCHLDSGVFRTHILLEGSLESGDQHSIFPESSGHDPHGHGTSMAGIALYGQHLDHLLEGTQVVHLQHRLESVRIIPQKGEKLRKITQAQLLMQSLVLRRTKIAGAHFACLSARSPIPTQANQHSGLLLLTL